MYPEKMAVRVTDESHSLAGLTGFILRNAKADESSDGYPIPDGWVELVFDPMDTNGYHTELFREENIDVCGC